MSTSQTNQHPHLQTSNMHIYAHFISSLEAKEHQTALPLRTLQNLTLDTTVNGHNILNFDIGLQYNPAL